MTKRQRRRANRRDKLGQRWHRWAVSRYARGVLVPNIAALTVPGIGHRWTVRWFCLTHGYDRKTFVRPRCRRWWLELRRVRLRTRLSVQHNNVVTTLARDVKHNPITSDDILRTWHRCAGETLTIAREVRGHPLALQTMCEAIPRYTAAEGAPEQASMKLFGLPIVEDPTLGREEIRLVFNNGTSTSART